MENTNIGRYLSYLLRHHPEAAGLHVDEHGWADVDELICCINQQPHKSIDMELLDEIVKTDNKQRFSFSEDKKLIRANQGHSIPVDVELDEKQPPNLLYHGTASRFLRPIMEEGLKPMSRLYVHLSMDSQTAIAVGKRHGSPVVFTIDTIQMACEGYKFYLSSNGVWLTKEVPARFLTLL